MNFFINVGTSQTKVEGPGLRVYGITGLIEYYSKTVEIPAIIIYEQLLLFSIPLIIYLEIIFVCSTFSFFNCSVLK